MRILCAGMSVVLVDRSCPKCLKTRKATIKLLTEDYLYERPSLHQDLAMGLLSFPSFSCKGFPMPEKEGWAKLGSQYWAVQLVLSNPESEERAAMFCGPCF